MDRPITITPSEMYTAIMAVCGTITITRTNSGASGGMSMLAQIMK